MRNMNWRKNISKRTALAAPLIISMAIGGVTLGWSASAQAQQPVPEAGSTPNDEDVAKQVLVLIREANASFKAGDYPAASKTYEKAYALYPDPAILVRLGKTAEKLNNDAEALGYYKEFVRLLPDDPTSAELAETIAKLEENVTVKLTVLSEPDGASIFIDGAETPYDKLTPTTIDLKPGEHTVLVQREGFEDATKAVDVASTPDEVQQVSLTLTRQMLSDTTAANFDTEKVENVDSARLDIYGWTTLGLGAATLATSGVFYALATSAEDDVNSYNKRAPDASRDDLQSLKDDANTNYDVSTITAIAGGVLAATGVGLLTYHYMSAEESDDGTSIAWGLDATGDSQSAWLGLNGSF